MVDAKQMGKTLAEEVRKRVAKLVEDEKEFNKRLLILKEAERRVAYRDKMVSSREKRIFGRVRNE